MKKLTGGGRTRIRHLSVQRPGLYPLDHRRLLTEMQFFLDFIGPSYDTVQYNKSVKMFKRANISTYT